MQPRLDQVEAEDSGVGLDAALQRLRPMARRLSPGMKLRLRRWLRTPAPMPMTTIRPHVALGFGINHAGFFPMDAYDIEQKAAWMCAKALVRLTDSPGNKLRIAGEHRAEVYRLATSVDSRFGATRPAPPGVVAGVAARGAA